MMPGKRLFANPFMSLSLLFLFSLALRLYGLDQESLFMDELHQVSYYPHSFMELIDDAARQQQPPLDYWIGHIIYQFSKSDFAMRLPAALFGSGAVVLLAALIGVNGSWLSGIFWGMIYSLMPFNLYFSQEARPYMISIFFMLATCAACYYYSKSSQRHYIGLMSVLALTVCFLHTRALAPIVVVSSLALILLTMSYAGRRGNDNRWKRFGELTLVLVTGITIYLPRLLIIAGAGQRYLSKDEGILSFSLIEKTFRNLNLTALWKAFWVQSEPFGYLFLLLILCAPLSLIRSHGKQYWTKIWLALLLFSSLLNLFIFQMKATLVFRPPYAIYMLPLVFLIAASSCLELLRRLHHFQSPLLKRMLMSFVILGAVGITAQAIASHLDSRQLENKPDWRGLCKYVQNNYTPRQLFIFDSLSPFRGWEPTFYGFRRYYQGKFNGLAMKDLGQYLLEKEGNIDSEFQPVLILFQWKDYYLTNRSKYPFLFTENPHVSANDYQKFENSDKLRVKSFLGFSVVELREADHNFISDAGRLIEIYIQNFPEGTWMIDPHITAAVLAKYNETTQKEKQHLAAVQRLMPASYVKELESLLSNF